MLRCSVKCRRLGYFPAVLSAFLLFFGEKPA